MDIAEATFYRRLLAALHLPAGQWEEGLYRDGYRRLHIRLQLEGWQVNHKRL